MSGNWLQWQSWQAPTDGKTGLCEVAKTDLKARYAASEARSGARGSLATTAAALAKLGCLAESIDQGRLPAVRDPYSDKCGCSHHGPQLWKTRSACSS